MEIKKDIKENASAPLKIVSVEGFEPEDAWEVVFFTMFAWITFYYGAKLSNENGWLNISEHVGFLGFLLSSFGALAVVIVGTIVVHGKKVSPLREKVWILLFAFFNGIVFNSLASSAWLSNLQSKGIVPAGGILNDEQSGMVSMFTFAISVTMVTYIVLVSLVRHLEYKAQQPAIMLGVSSSLYLVGCFMTSLQYLIGDFSQIPAILFGIILFFILIQSALASMIYVSVYRGSREFDLIVTSFANIMTLVMLIFIGLIYI